VGGLCLEREIGAVDVRRSRWTKRDGIKWRMLSEIRNHNLYATQNHPRLCAFEPVETLPHFRASRTSLRRRERERESVCVCVCVDRLLPKTVRINY
jgi:hypothetical protein